MGSKSMTSIFHRKRVILQAVGGRRAGFLPHSSLEKSLKYNGMDADKASSILAIAEKSLVEWQTTFSRFLSPAEMNAVEQAFSNVIDIKIQSSGGMRRLRDGRIAAFGRLDDRRGRQRAGATRRGS